MRLQSLFFRGGTLKTVKGRPANVQIIIKRRMPSIQNQMRFPVGGGGAVGFVEVG